MKDLAILIPSYNRPEVLRATIRSWIRTGNDIIVTVECNNEKCAKEYKELLGSYGNVIYEVKLARLGSVKARNRLMQKALERGYEYMLMCDDDYFLPEPSMLRLIKAHFERDKTVGAAGGKVISIRRRRKDPDFFLNLPIADALSETLGYVFLDVKHGPRHAKYLSPFYALRSEVAKKVMYDPLFETPTGFREESDVHRQVRVLGYKLIFDPRVYVYHLAVEYGGNRPKISEAERMYWKARNQAIFIRKWSRSLVKSIWCLLSSTFLLIIYRPWYISWVFQGTKDGINTHFIVPST